MPGEVQSLVRHPAQHIFDHTPESLAQWFAQRGSQAFRAKQVLEWVYAKGVVDPAAMTNLAKRDRDLLSAEMVFLSGDVLRDQLATDGTRKLLVQWRDFAGPQSSRDEARPAPDHAAPVPPGEEHPGHEQPGDARAKSIALPLAGTISPGIVSSAKGDAGVAPPIGEDSTRQTECVMIPAESKISEVQRRTACISSQIGCPVGCKFCASGLGGLDGNLSAGRIVEQVWLLRHAMRAAPVRGSRPLAASDAVRGREREFPRITHVVFMGMGEPLANFNNVTNAVRTLAALWGMGISARRITISTVGLPPMIERLAAELEVPVTLALSLHAPTDDVRRSLIPWAEYTTIDALLAACDKWFQRTGREITLEYTLLRGVNDRPEQAEQLAKVAKRLRARINLIRYNEVRGIEFGRPRTEDVLEFQRVLQARGLKASIRASRGRDIAAACGQLRHETAAGV
ncbi:MAG: 23S rRNA (adenine(2503)-C(2))-methyltransferase RlmN [Planctomycetota bacterium]|nr:23S rRNA (adenine(2503)-C(2))-methyltransferase RlmN [Planctomycetota bacterium]